MGSKMDIVERWRERKRKRLLERRMLGIMREDAKPFDENEHPRGKGGKFVSKNGGNVAGATELPPTRQHISQEKFNVVKGELERRIVGKKTTDGRVVKAIGPHLVFQCIKRGIYPETVANVVARGKRDRTEEKRGRFVYKYRGTMIVLISDGNLMNAIYKGKEKKQ